MNVVLKLYGRDAQRFVADEPVVTRGIGVNESAVLLHDRRKRFGNRWHNLSELGFMLVLQDFNFSELAPVATDTIYLTFVRRRGEGWATLAGR